MGKSRDLAKETVTELRAIRAALWVIYRALPGYRPYVDELMLSEYEQAREEDERSML